MFLLKNHIQEHIHVYGILLELSVISMRRSPRRSRLVDTESIESVQFYRGRGSGAAECSSLTEHIQTSTLPRILSGATASVVLTPTHFSSLPRAQRSPSQVSICRPSSFISQKIPFTFSIYFTDTFSSPLFAFFCPPPLPPPILHPFAVPLPLKQSSFFLSLFIYMTPRFSQRQVRMAKGRLLQNGSGLISSPCFSSQPKSFIAELTVLLVIALSFCKYHGLSLIFILLPPLSPRTPSVDQYRLGLGARPALGSYHPPLPCSKYCIRNTKDFLGTTSNAKQRKVLQSLHSVQNNQNSQSIRIKTEDWRFCTNHYWKLWLWV